MKNAAQAAHDIARMELDEAFAEATILVDAAVAAESPRSIWDTCVEINESIFKHWKRYVANSLTRAHE